MRRRRPFVAAGLIALAALTAIVFAVGATGAPAGAGSPGATGATRATGSPGVIGATRATGSPGVTGATGAIGSAAFGCPSAGPGAPVSQRPGASTALVPDGASRLVVCEFNFIGYPGAGARKALIGAGATSDGPTVTQIAGELDALTMGPDAPIACPADAGQAYVALFEYPSGVADPVRIQLGGCDLTTNGYVTRLAIGSPVVGQVTGLVRPLAQAPSVVPPPLGPGPVVISRIAGVLRLCGGPAPGRCHVENITSCLAGHGCVKDDRVRIAQNGSTVDSVRLRKGRFSVVVSPGAYTVQLLGDGRHVHGEVIQSKTVVVGRYATAHVTFTIAVP